MKSGWKRLARSERQMARKAGNQQMRPLFLVVCEDAKAAPAYFGALRTHLRLSTAIVEICGQECGSAPISVVDYAIRRRQEHRENGRAVDVVFCVVDVDAHSSLLAALDKARAHALHGVVSSPSFELWFLLHFVNGGRSYADHNALLRDLKKHLPGYSKGSFAAFDCLWNKTHAAIQRARSLVSLRGDDRLRNPSTEVHFVVEAFIAQSQVSLVDIG